MQHSIQFGSREIKFQLVRSNRKSLGITVTPELKVIVTSPEDVELDKIKEKIRKRAPWILKQESFFLTFHPKTPKRKYVAGESHLYLGREYILKIKPGNKNDVNRKRNTLEVITSNKAKVKELILQWYRVHAKQKFIELAEPLIEQFKKYKVKPSGIYLHNMPTRWGSCTPTGKIILNPELIKAPKKCIEYVIIHELCHLVYRNHTQKFFGLQRKMMPDWERWKERLDKLLV